MLKLLKRWIGKIKLAVTGIPLASDKIKELTAPESQYEEQIKWQITLTCKNINQEIVDICQGKSPDVREYTKPIEWSEEALKNLRKDMYDIDGKPFVYRGKVPYTIKE